MNREIKFKAWYLEELNMYWFDLMWGNHGQGGGYIGMVEWGMPKYNSGIDATGFTSNNVRLIDPNNCTIMQYTGLKDKNGVEIYEGDILRWPAKDNWEKENYSCFEVFFHGGDAHWDYNIGFTMCRMHNHGSIAGGYIPSFKPKQVGNMEVIGNIHQHPHLITPSHA